MSNTLPHVNEGGVNINVKHMNKTILSILLIINTVAFLSAQSLGRVQANTNLALPNSYNFTEYVFAEPDDQGTCAGIQNNTAEIAEVFIAQTHRHTLDHPFFFTIGHRPALLQLAITGSGPAPDVQVTGTLNNESLGTLCLNGPDMLQSSIDLEVPNFEDYFSVTLPKSWIKTGLSLTVTAGDKRREISADALKIGPYTELNLVMVNIDFIDYSSLNKQKIEPFDDFLNEVASSIPASVVRFGTFPKTLKFPVIVATDGTEELVRIESLEDKENAGIGDGNINTIALKFIEDMIESTNDALSTVYFGNTLNLRPGGWGGNRAFVGFEYKLAFIHELGHALSLPHWGDASDQANPDKSSFLYPYGGFNDKGAGRGRSYSFIQDKYEFVSPTCSEIGRDGFDRSDAMQRSNFCKEVRSVGIGPWDGFSDFSALAMHRFLAGASTAYRGQIEDKGVLRNFKFNERQGYPHIVLNGDKRVYESEPSQPEHNYFLEKDLIPGGEKLNQDVYLIYGTAHSNQPQANVMHKPVKYNGTLPFVVDITDPQTFELLKEENRSAVVGNHDLTYKVTYKDGTVLHALDMYTSLPRNFSHVPGLWRNDVLNFAMVVPGDKEIQKVELYRRPYLSLNPNDDSEGNVNYEPHNITAENFMDDAVLLSSYEFECDTTTSDCTNNEGSNNEGNNNEGDNNDIESLVTDKAIIYPNPFEDVITVALENFEGKSLEIINTLTQSVLKASLTDEETTINIDPLSPGLYFAMIKDEDGHILYVEALLRK